MDAETFDRLVRALTGGRTRRGLLRLVAALPLAGTVMSQVASEEAQGNGAVVGGGGHRRHRHKKRHRHHPGDNKGKHKGKQKGKRECTAESPAQTCAGTCGDVPNNCGQSVDCGSCACTPPCPVCQTCDAATGQCVPNPASVSQACASCLTCTAAGTCGAPAPNRTICGGSGGTSSLCCNGTCCAGCCGSDGACGACLVFATSSLQNAALGGLNGADGICQTQALAGGLPGGNDPGTYRAWLSDDTGSPSTRFRCTAAVCSGQGYRLPDAAQTLIATDWTDLTDGTLIHAINVTELGGTVPTSGPTAFAWSNTVVAARRKKKKRDTRKRQDASPPPAQPQGTVTVGAFDCVAWTFGGPPAPEPFEFGGTGSANATDTAWTKLGSSPCDIPRRLYCFQQG